MLGSGISTEQPLWTGTHAQQGIRLRKDANVMANQPQVIRILLVDDHAIVRQGLQMFLDGEPGFRVIGMTGDRTTALELATREQPDVILLDLDLGGESGLDLLPDLLAAAP